ncbi:lysophospholipid acyltransferase family protein [Marinilabilia sp.]
MNNILGYLFSPIFHFYTVFLIVFFYPVQVVALHGFGDHARRRSVDLLNVLLVKGLYIMGASIRFEGLEKLPKDRPVVIVSNHQSMYDIPAVGWAFRKYYPKFISKIELSRNLFSISYNLKHGKSALIDRRNGSQAVKEIFKLGRLIEKNNYAACIFPEGTRSVTGHVKPFKTAGIQTLLRATPSSVVVPFVISGHNRLLKKGNFPLQFGQKIKYEVLDPIEPKDYTTEEIVALLQEKIEKSLS